MILLLDIGNTNTHLGLGDSRRVLKQANIPTSSWFDGRARKLLARFAGARRVEAAALCSVVPKVTNRAVRVIESAWGINPLVLGPRSLRVVGIDYPKPNSIGPDRLANAAAVRHHFGAPAVVVDFGTAVTFDLVDRAGNYVGGIIAPGLSAMTDYLHEKTALLPRIKIREIKTAVGKNTEEAMLIGAVHGYRGLIRGLLTELKRELRCQRLPVVATGGYSKLIDAR